MQKRSIGWPIVIAVLTHGDMQPARNWGVKYVLNGFCVVTIHNVIVTTYQLKGTKKHEQKKKGKNSERKALTKIKKAGKIGRGRGKAEGYFVP